MSTQDREQKIREKRIAEAMEKKFMGMGGKFGMILKHLGEPIKAHNSGGGLIEQSFIDDPYSDDISPEEARNASELLDSIPTNRVYVHDQNGSIIGEHNQDISEVDSNWASKSKVGDSSIYDMGHHFDGLRWGMHLEIWYQKNKRELKVTYQGHEVYKELEGELTAYSPSMEWENKIESLFLVAKKRDKKEKKEYQKEKIQLAEKRKESWWQKIRKQWGL